MVFLLILKCYIGYVLVSYTEKNVGGGGWKVCFLMEWNLFAFLGVGERGVGGKKERTLFNNSVLSFCRNI